MINGWNFAVVAALLAISLEAASAQRTTPSPQRQTGEAEKPIDVEWQQLEFDQWDAANLSKSGFPARIRALEGKRIRLRGFYHGGSLFKQENIEAFVLRAEVRVPEWIAPEDRTPRKPPMPSWLTVRMVNGQTTRFTTKSLAVTGRFSIRIFKFNGKPLCFYHLDADSIEVVKPREGYYARRGGYWGC